MSGQFAKEAPERRITLKSVFAGFGAMRESPEEREAVAARAKEAFKPFATNADESPCEHAVREIREREPGSLEWRSRIYAEATESERQAIDGARDKLLDCPQSLQAGQAAAGAAWSLFAGALYFGATASVAGTLQFTAVVAVASLFALEMRRAIKRGNLGAAFNSAHWAVVDRLEKSVSAEKAEGAAQAEPGA